MRLTAGTRSAAGPGACSAPDAAADPTAHPLAAGDLAAGRQPGPLAGRGVPRIDPGAAAGQHGAHRESAAEATEIEEEEAGARAVVVVVAVVVVDDLAVLVGAIGDLILLAADRAASEEA